MSRFKKIISFGLSVSVLLFAIPAPAFASTQVLIGNSQAGSNTYALVASGGGNNSGVHSDVFSVSGTLSNLMVYTDVPPGGTTVKKAAISSASGDSVLSCTLTGTDQTCTDTTHSLSVSAGDYFNMHLTNQSGSPKTGDYSWSVEFTPTNANDTVLLGATTNNGNNSRTWLPFSGFTATAEANLLQAIPEDGTIDAFTLSYPSFTSGSMQWNIWLNSASSTLDCTGTGGSTSCVDSTHSESVSQGDTISVSQVPFSPGTSVRPGFGARYVPATAGDFPILSGTMGSIDSVSGSTDYIPFSGGMARNAIEATTTQVVGTAFTVSSMTVVRAAGPGSGKIITYTLRVNGADSSLSCSLFDTGSGVGITTNTCTGSVSLSPGDLVDWETTLSSGGTTAHAAIGAVGWFPGYSCDFGVPIGGGQCQGFLTSGTSWTVPNDWNSSSNKIEAIGAGGSGHQPSSGGRNTGGGGGGGAYAKITNQSLTPGGSVTIQIGTGGGGPGSTGDTYLKNNSNTTVLLARGGTSSAGTSGGVGGDTTNSVGSTKYAGGDGGDGTNDGSNNWGGAGGGGSAGPSGAGNNGGTVTATSGSGAGGGGSNGGSSTAGSGPAASGVGGSGGAGTSGSGGGKGGSNASTVAGGTGAFGGGGGGSGRGTSTLSGTGGVGGTDTAFDSTHGAGGGGGGSGGINGSGGTTTGDGGAGGLYGGGGGGAGYSQSGTEGAGGAGGQGLIAITYTPGGGGGSAPTVTTDNATAIGAASAVLNATIDDNGGDDATEHGFAYSTDSTLSSSVSTTTDGAFTGTGYFNDTINSLSNNTRYYFRAYATNGTGTGYGGIMNLFTGDSIPRRGIILFSGYKIKLVGGKIILHQQ